MPDVDTSGSLQFPPAKFSDLVLFTLSFSCGLLAPFGRFVVCLLAACH